MPGDAPVAWLTTVGLGVVRLVEMACSFPTPSAGRSYRMAANATTANFPQRYPARACRYPPAAVSKPPGRRTRIAPMGPASAEIEVDAPRERVFELIGDLSRRPSFTDHFLADFRLTRIEPLGLGAGARFRVALPPRDIWMDTEIVALEPPQRIVERGCGGRGNRVPSHTVWELLEGAGSLTRVRVSHWTQPSNPLDRVLDALGGTAVWQERAWRRALRRLRDLLESGAPPEPGLAVAGGNAQLTGIP